MDKRKVYIISVVVLLFRSLDFYTTNLAVVDFYIQEQNLLVKAFKVSFCQLILIDLLIVVFFLWAYHYSLVKANIYNIKSSNFKEYTIMYFFEKEKISFFDISFRVKIKKVLILFGSIAPIFLITTSTLFSLNNFLVYGVNVKNEKAIKYYSFFESFYFFDFIIFIFPILFLFCLMFFRLKKGYLFYNCDNF